MQNEMRDRLIELIDDFIHYENANDLNSDERKERLADYLIEEGVIVPPCKVDDTVYEITSKEVLCCTVTKIEISLTDRTSTFIDILIHYPTYSATETIETQDFGETVFLTKEEAEKALKEGVCNAEISN